MAKKTCPHCQQEMLKATQAICESCSMALHEWKREVANGKRMGMVVVKTPMGEILMSKDEARRYAEQAPFAIQQAQHVVASRLRDNCGVIEVSNPSPDK